MSKNFRLPRPVTGSLKFSLRMRSMASACSWNMSLTLIVIRFIAATTLRSSSVHGTFFCTGYSRSQIALAWFSTARSGRSTKCSAITPSPKATSDEPRNHQNEYEAFLHSVM